MPFKWAARACALLAGSLLPAVASAALTVTPVTWNVIGLDSNTPATGPRYFPVGERVCSTTPTGPITVTLTWDSVNPYISTRAGSLNPITLPPMAAGACADAYFEVDVTQVAAAFDTKRRFHVTATEGANSATSPQPRELYVEHLISQSRNGITAVKLNGVSIPAGGTMAMVVGGTYTIELDSFTATQGYNQFESFINFTNTVFQILSVQTTYSSDNSPYVPNPNNKFYADACGWDPNPASPNYNACIGGDFKAGGTVTTIYTIKIIGGGGTSQTLNTLLYDFSGSSFHYNADFGVGARIATIVDPTSLNFAKAFSPSTVPPGGTANLVFTIGNPNAAAMSGLSFNDTLPSSSGIPMTIAGAPTSSGCGTPSFTAVVNTSNFSFSNGSVAANASCVVTLPVKIAASPTSGTYNNVSGNLFANGTDTGKNALATLTIGSSSTGTGVCGLTMASWNFTGYTVNPPVPTVQAANVATAAIVAGSSITIQPDASVGNPVPSLAGYGWPNAAAQANNYIEFQLDTSKYTAVNLTFDYRRKSPGPNPIQLFYLNSSSVWTQLGANIATTTSFQSSGARDFTGLTSTTGTTFFRIYGFGANNTNQGSDLNLDNIVFTGCSTPVGPTLTKSFTPPTIPVNGTSVLTFTLTNTNSAALTGARFTDALPAGVQVAATPNASTTCTGSPTWAPAAGATNLTFGTPTGANIPASGSCTASVTVTATTAGPHTNVSGYVSTTEGGTNATSTGSATASLTGLLPPSIQKSFGASSIPAGGQTTITLTITNPNADVALSGVAFTDNYPANLTNANPLVPAPTNTCGGTLTAAAGGNGVSLSGGSVPAGGNCSITVPVTASAAGPYTNTTGNVTATGTGTGNTGSANLTVTAPNPAINLLKQVSTTPTGPWVKFIAADPATTQLYFRFVAENVGDVPFNPFSVSDPQLASQGIDPATCAWQTDNVPSTLPALPVASPSSSPVATCVKGPIALTSGPHTNTATASGTYNGNAYPSDPSSTDWFGVVPGFSLTKQISISADGPWTSNIVVASGTGVYYRFALVNTGNVPLTSVNVTDPLVSTASCTFIDPLPVGGATTCVVGPVTATGGPGTSTPNTATGHGTNGGVVQNTAPSTASYTITSLVADLAITKTNGVTSLVAGSPVTYTIVASNTGPDAVAGAQIVDTLSADLVGASWTCVGAGGGTCTASGAGSINDTANLPVGASVTYTLSATVSPSAASPLSNTATITPPAGVNDPNAGNNSATDSDPVSAPTADLAITKTNGVASVTAGSGVTYTIVASNAGPFAVTGATVADTLPASLTGVSWTCVGAGGGTCTASGSGNISDTVNLPVGASVTYTVTATLSASASGTLSNTATVAVPAGIVDPNPGNNSATDSDPIAAQADLAITKTNGVSLVTAGGSVTYTITASNAGPSNATGATVADTLPAILTGITWTCVGAGGGTCTASGSGNISDTVNLPAGGSVTYTVSATLSPSASGTLANTATVAPPGGVTDPNPGNNSATDSDPIAAQADLAITKTNGVTAVNAGSLVTYTIVASNAGPSNAAGATVADTLPGSLTGATWTCVGAGGGTCTAAGSGSINDTVNLPAGGSVTYTLTATVSAPSGTLTNTATVSPPAGVTDPNPGNNSATDSDPITPVADLSIVKSDGVSTVTPGNGVTYTIVVSNAGPSPANGAIVNDVLPATLLGATWTCVGAGGGTCTASGSGNINDSVNLPAGASVTYTLTATLNASASGSLVNTATVSAPPGVTDPNPSNNSSTDTDTINAVVGLGVTKTDGATTYTPGGTATYTIVVTNAGPSSAANVSINDALPAGVTLTATPTCTPNGTATCGTVTGAAGGNSVAVTGATIAAGAGNSLTLTVPVAFASSMTTDPLVNTVDVLDVASGGTANASDSDTRAAAVTIAVVKTDGSASYTPGGTATYQVTVTNGGISDATNVTVSDALPPGVTLTGTVTCLPTGIATCGTVTGTTGGTAFGTTGATIPAGGISSLVFSAPVAFAPSLVTDPLVNTAQATDLSSGATGSGSDSDVRSANVTLALTKTDGIAFYTPGGTATYTITVANTGSSVATNVSITDNLPIGVTLSAPATCTPSGTATCGAISGAAGASSFTATGAVLPSGAGNFLTITLPVQFAANLIDDPLINTVTAIDAGSGATGSASDSDTRSANAVLSVTKTDGSATYTPGGTATYTIVVSNGGPSDATAVAVNDALPAGVTLTGTVGCVAAGSASCGTVTGTTGQTSFSATGAAIAAGAGNTLTFTVPVAFAPSLVTNPLVNTVTVTSPDALAPASASDSDTLGASADVSIVKTLVTAGPYIPGQSIVYTLVVANAGPSTATSIQVTDTPSNLTITNVSGSGCVALPCTIPSLTPGANTTINVTATINAAGVFDNSASAFAVEFDPNLANNTDNAGNNGTASPIADLSITKTDGVTTVTAGSVVTYTIVAGNAGPNDALGATVSDTLPASLTGATWTCVASAGSSCPASGSGNINATVNLLAGGTATFTLSATLSASATGTLVNTATVAPPAGTTDPNPANNSATDTDTITAAPPPMADLAITKTNGVSSVTAGTPVTYSIVASNLGPSGVVGATVADTLPASLTGATWTCVGSGGGTCTASGNGNINDTVNLPVGSIVTYTLTATLSAAATGTLSNTATVAVPAGMVDPNPGNNSATDSDPITPAAVSADLAITKTNGVTSVTAGSTVTYTIVASNLGPSAVVGATVADTLPASLTGATWTCSASAGSSCPPSGSGGINASVNLLSGGTATFVLSATLSASATGTLTNTATVAVPAGTTDPNPGNNSATDSDPITATPPPVDLSITITNVGTFSRGQSGAQYAVTVSNVGGVPTSGTVTVTVVLPAGVTPTAMAGSGWSCTQPAGPCTTTAILGPGASYPVITITVDIAVNAPASLIATATVSGGGDTNGANNTSSNAVSLNAPPDVVEVPVNSPLALLLTLMLMAVVGGARLARRRVR
jgi:uncharacterized repeat protein (TIGR01451 family)